VADDSIAYQMPFIWIFPAAILMRLEQQSAQYTSSVLAEFKIFLTNETVVTGVMVCT
jgi:hypothetical protein